MSQQQAGRYQTRVDDDPVTIQQENQEQENAGHSALGTANYPPPDDSTSSGGYGSSKNVWSDRAQRGYVERAGDHSPQTGGKANERGLIDQTATGGPIGDELEDAKQGRDTSLSQNVIQ